ncbi:uncharacterized protein [Primulina eburnea]|uniref:uncharacterized protein isoform X2 n=1 Tax=Primulina eburnea TaxID=1245227 RepID=UPI003C6BF42F
MASSIAFVFSKVVDPKNPLYLDDSCWEETIDWEFRIATPIKGPSTAIVLEVNENSDRVQFNLVDPDEVIYPATLIDDSAFDEDDGDNGSEDSGTSCDSLKPYDLTDDDADLTRKFSQLADVIVTLRKSDDSEGALNVAEKLVRASPDELKYVAGDLARTLLMVRCSDLTM